jgi:putative ABC transport system substrate-binding protein
MSRSSIAGRRDATNASPSSWLSSVRLKVDIIVTQGTPAVIAAKQATSAIPIVFPIAGNPVANGLVASLARPGGNATGLTNQTADLAGKRIELLREMVPGLRQLAIMANIDNPSVALDIT